MSLLVKKIVLVALEVLYSAFPLEFFEVVTVSVGVGGRIAGGGGGETEEGDERSPRVLCEGHDCLVQTSGHHETCSAPGFAGTAHHHLQERNLICLSMVYSIQMYGAMIESLCNVIPHIFCRTDCLSRCLSVCVLICLSTSVRLSLSLLSLSSSATRAAGDAICGLLCHPPREARPAAQPSGPEQDRLCPPGVCGQRPERTAGCVRDQETTVSCGT